MNKLGAYKKKEASERNLQMRIKLLSDVRDGLIHLSPAQLQALRSQPSFAQLAIPTSDIYPLASNTLKSTADRLITCKDKDGNTGFKFLDQLRLSVFQQHSANAEAASEDSLSEAKRNEKRLAAAERSIVLRSRAYLDLFTKICNLAKKPNLDERTRLMVTNIIEDHHTMFGELLSPKQVNEENTPAGTVIPLILRDAE